MTLKSMLLQARVSRPGQLNLDETDIPFFGVYLRFVPGSFATQSQGSGGDSWYEPVRRTVPDRDYS